MKRRWCPDGIAASNEDRQRLVDQTVDRWGRIDVLMNSTGCITGQNLRIDVGLTRSVQGSRPAVSRRGDGLPDDRVRQIRSTGAVKRYACG